MAHQLSDLLASPQLFENELEWHNLIHEGMPTDTLARLAKALKITEKKLRATVFTGRKISRSGILSRDCSNIAYRVGLALCNLTQNANLTEDAAASWLLGTQPVFKGRQPLQMLLTQQGADYVYSAIARLSPSSTERV